MEKRQPTRQSKREIWHPADYDIQDIRSIQCLALYAMGAERPWPPGEEPPVPTPYDVKRALDWIVHKAAMTYDNGTAGAFEANDPHGRIPAFIDGRRDVGQQIVKLMKLKVSAFEPNAPRNEEGIGPQGETAREI